MDSLALLDRLDNLKQTRPDEWRSRCPAHEGRSRSLAIKYVDSRLLIHCFAGCDKDEIVEAAGMVMSDLFDKTPDSSPADRKDRIQTKNAREILQSITVPIRAVMIAVRISQNRLLTREEMEALDRASDTVNQALDSAVNQGVVNVR